MEDGICYYCGEPTCSLAGNPGRWPIGLCHDTEPGVTKVHCTQCVMSRLHAFDHMMKLIKEWNIPILPFGDVAQ